MKYGIKWRSKTTGLDGKGEACFLNRGDAQAMADRMDREHPELNHNVWVDTTEEPKT